MRHNDIAVQFYILMMKAKICICIGLLSLTILATELFWTRLFSAEYYYTFAFLILSLAVLGLGLGALFFKLVPGLNRQWGLPLWLGLTGLMILVAVPLVFMLELDFSKLISEPTMILKLICAIMLLGSGYFFGGISIAHLFKNNAADIARLYKWDFIGAAVGVVAFILIMNAFGAEVTLVFCAIPVLVASFLMASRWMKIFPVMILLAAIAGYYAAGWMPEQKREEPSPVIYKHWDATAKIKIYERDSTVRGINIDNIANSPVYRFDGNWNMPDSMKFQFGIDVGYLMKKFSGCRFLSLGAGGGTDVLQALQYNSSEVHAVEVIPHINYLLREGPLKEYSGNIYNDPRVKVITEDARAYIRKFSEKFDIIYSLSSNSWAAFASGSFALAENYIFTTEAFKDYWRALSPKGFLSIEHQFYAPRLVSELIDALGQMKVADPKSHFAVYNLPGMRRKILLVSKQPLDEETIMNAYGKLTPDNYKQIHLLYPATERNKGNIYNRIVQFGWRPVAINARVDISPCTDDRPFIAQLGLMKNVKLSELDQIPLYEFNGFPLSRIIMLIILVVCIIIIVPLNLLPYLFKGEKLKFIPWFYFFLIGMGYMMLEVILIQQYTLYIGSTIYSLALVLTVMLVSSGIGSQYSSRFSSSAVFIAIAVWLIADIFLFRQLFYLLDQWALFPRMILSALLIAPLGFFMGMPFPKAAAKLTGHIDWAFAVTGSASVIGSVVIILIASSFGYSIALLTGMVIYLLAYSVYRVKLEKL